MTTSTLSLKIKRGTRAKLEAISFPEVNWKIICLMGFFASLVLLVFYVWQINDLTKGSYLVNSYEKQISDLSDENKNLQVSFAENSFLGGALTKSEALNFQKVTTVKYIQIPESSVALAETK